MSNWQRWKGIMKAVPFEEKRLLKWSPPFIIQPKYDGVRCRAVPTDSGYLLLSSEENVIFSVPHINNLFDQLGLGKEIDGELYHHNWPFESIVSVTSRTVNLHPDHLKIQFHAFDVIEPGSQMERLHSLLSLPHEPPLKIAPFWLCSSLEEIMSVFYDITSDGFEGIIVRSLHAPYERKRSTHIMKFKPKKTDEYLITGFKEEIDKNGSPKGTLGALVCVGSDGVEFSVGTGFSQDDRRSYWAERERLIGKVCRVSYQHLTTGKSVPRFPVFVEVLR